MVEQAERALVDNPVAGVYQRGTELVHVIRSAKPPRPGVVRPQDTPITVPLSYEALRVQLARSSVWIMKRKNDVRDVVPPHNVVATLLRKQEWALIPFITGVVEAPTIREDGSLLDEPGYDEASGFLYEPVAVFPSVPSRPSRDDAARAAMELREPFSEFPFVTEDDWAAAMAFVLSIIGRPCIAGPTPLFAVRGSTRGTGKSLLVRGVSQLSTGREPTLTSVPPTNAEMAKHLLSYCVEGTRVVLFDNAVGVFGFPSLAAALTSDEYSGRGLGLNRILRAPFRTVLAVTGNNISFRGDTARRVVGIDMEPNVPNPEERRFRIEDLIAWIRAEQPRLARTALIILRAFFTDGCPGHGRPPMGSFEAWDRVVRGACIWVGAGDPCASRERIRAEADPESDLMVEGLTVLRDQFKNERFTARDVVTAAEHSEAVRTTILSLSPPNGSGPPNARAVGYALREWSKRVVEPRCDDGKPLGWIRLISAGKIKHLAAWRVEEVSDGNAR
jgi:putative DNA primase/helicase